MLEGSFKFKGLIKTDIKEKNDKYYFTFNTYIKSNDKLKSLVYVEIDKTLFQKIKDDYKIKPVEIYGEIIAKKTKNDLPFVYFIANNINIVNDNTKNKKVNNNKFKNKGIKISLKDKFEDSEYTYIDLNKIHITEEEHMKGLIEFDKKAIDINTPIAVRKIDEDNYSLVLGFREFAYFKLLDVQKVRVLITELSNKDFKNKYFPK